MLNKVKIQIKKKINLKPNKWTPVQLDTHLELFARITYSIFRLGHFLLLFGWSDVVWC